MNELHQIELHEKIAAHPFLKGCYAQYLPLFFKAATYQRFGADSLTNLPGGLWRRSFLLDLQRCCGAGVICA